MPPTINVTWKKSGDRYRATIELALPLPTYDIRRPENNMKRPFVRRSVLEGVTRSSMKKQPNRRVPFLDGEKVGLKTKESHLELRWEPYTEDPAYEWMCHYELIVPTVDGKTMRTRLGGTRRGGGSREPIDVDGKVETPFRDGAHIRWDGAALGVKAFAIYKDKKTEIETKEKV